MTTGELFSTVSRTWPEISKGMAIGLAVGVVLFVVILALVEKVRSKRRRQVHQDESYERLRSLSRQRNLIEPEMDLLANMVRRAGLADPRDVFDSVALFEQCVEAQFDHFDKSGELPEAVREAAQRIRRIREKLGYRTLPQEKALISTRELPTGQILRVRSLVSPDAEGVSAAVIDVTEIEIALRLALTHEGQMVLKKGDFLQFQMTRASDGEYNFGARIAEVKGNLSEVLIVEHPRQLHRRQSRNHVRVPAHVPLRFRIIRSAIADFSTDLQEATIGDVSGGGLSFSRSAALRTGDLISMNFDLETGGFRGLQGKVLRAGAANKAGQPAAFRHHIQFLGIDNAARERIIRYVFDKQREENLWR